MKIGQSPFVLVVESFNQKTGVSPLSFYPNERKTYKGTSSGLNSERGCWNAN